MSESANNCNVGRVPPRRVLTPRQVTRPSAPVSALNQWGESPRSGLDLTPIVKGNCVAARRGGEQPETNCWSIG